MGILVHTALGEVDVVDYFHSSSTFICFFKDLDGVRDMFWIKSLGGTSNEVIWPPKKFKFHAWVKKCHFGNFTRNRLIGWIGHALLVQPSISAHKKWPEMVVSASTNQV